MADDNANLARRWFEEVWNQGRTATIDELFAADGRMRGIGGPDDVVHGPAGFRAAYDVLKGAFHDIHFTIDEAIAERDIVAVRWTATATHKGDDLGVPATGNALIITGMGFARVRDGQFVEAWNNWDMLGMMQATGQIPPAKVL